jgi:hypothetical protein
MPRLSKIGAACLAAFGFSQGGVVVDYVLVAGGGGTYNVRGGGGGAGGVLSGSASLTHKAHTQ